jgi:Cu2+-exporting ATPase
LVLACDGRVVAEFSLREVLRPQASEQIQALERAGYAVWLLSGDRPDRAAALAARVGILAAHAEGGLSPAAKAERVRALDAHDTLYVGDGVNDAPAFAAAWCAGTPAVERPVMPSRSGFFFLGEGLSPLTAALAASQRLHRVVRQLLTVSLTYNLFAVAAGLAGAITPLKAAIFMPLSSLSLLAFTAWSLRDERPASLPALKPAEVTP